MNLRLRRVVPGLTLGVAVLLGGAWMVFERAVYEPPATPVAAAAPPAAPPAGGTEAVVETVEGPVQRSVRGAWSPLSAGDRLHVDDSVRTGAGARADLRIGAKSRIAVAQGSQLVIRELSDKVHRFKLTRGNVRVDYTRDGERVLRIEGEGEGAAAAETRAATFSVLSTGRSIAIATDSGAVALKAQGRQVVVEAGHQSTARSGEAPAPPRPIPASLWLKVANALAAPPEGTCADVRGSAPAGSEVTIDGREVELSPDGTFAASVARAPGKAAAVVAIRDASGRTTTRKVACGAEVGGVRDVALHWHAKEH